MRERERGNEDQMEETAGKRELTPTDLPVVLHALTESLSQNKEIRENAENRLKDMETMRNFGSCLLVRDLTGVCVSWAVPPPALLGWCDDDDTSWWCFT